MHCGSFSDGSQFQYYSRQSRQVLLPDKKATDNLKYRKNHPLPDKWRRRDILKKSGKLPVAWQQKKMQNPGQSRKNCRKSQPVLKSAGWQKQRHFLREYRCHDIRHLPAESDKVQSVIHRFLMLSGIRCQEYYLVWIRGW